MTLINEQKLEGKLKGKLDIIENMIDAGFDWQLIYQTTGIDSEK